MARKGRRAKKYKTSPESLKPMEYKARLAKPEPGQLTGKQRDFVIDSWMRYRKKLDGFEAKGYARNDRAQMLYDSFTLFERQYRSRAREYGGFSMSKDLQHRIINDIARRSFPGDNTIAASKHSLYVMKDALRKLQIAAKDDPTKAEAYEKFVKAFPQLLSWTDEDIEIMSKRGELIGPSQVDLNVFFKNADMMLVSLGIAEFRNWAVSPTD